MPVARLGKCLPLLAAILSMAGAAAAQPQQAGAAGGVQGEVLLASAGLPAGAIGRAVKSGESIFIGDRIRSGGESGLQVLLLDETVFTIGADSDVTIDQFVYDPGTGAGKLAATLGKGAFRFVTGKIAQNRPEDMSVRTPNATIGIRGTIVWGQSTDTEDTIVLGGPGPGNNANERVGGMRVDPSGGGQGADVRREGYAAFVRPGQPVDVRQLDQATRERISGQLSAGQRRAQQQLQAGGGGEAGGGGLPPNVQQAQQVSGQSTANTSADAPEQKSFQAAQDEGSQNQQAAAQTTTNTGKTFTTFEDLRTVQTGSAHFSGSGTLSGSGSSGSYSHSATINFASRSISTSFSYSFSGSFSGSGSLSTSGSYLTGGTGKVTETASSSCSSGPCTATGTTTFSNSGSTIANSANTTLSVTNGSQTVSGSGTSPRGVAP